jgi:threonine/homoserine/homoserine lactone efflux protein
MGTVIGEILPLAVGIAISPIPIVAVILMLLSPRAKSTSVWFMIGWVAGVAVAVVVFTLLFSVLPQSTGGASRVAGVIKIILGLLLLFLALRQWRSRPAEGEPPTMPKWMLRIEEMNAGKAFGLGFLLAAVNPKNLLLAISAGVIIAGLPFDQAVIAIIIFVLLAACTVIVPVIGYLIAANRLAGPLDKLREWLVDNNAAILAVVLLVIGVAVIGKGIAEF